jgi:hypothetical protein
MISPLSYKKGICPYCKSDIPSEASVCKNCGRDVSLIYEFIDFIGNTEANLQKVRPPIKEQRVSTAFILIYLLLTTYLTSFLLSISAVFIEGDALHTPSIYQFEIFLWFASLIYAYISATFFAVRNFWILTFFPAVVPLMLFTLFKNFASIVPSNYPIFITQLLSTIATCAGISFLTGALYWQLKTGLKIKEFFNINFFLAYLTQYTNRAESLQKLVLTLITLSSIVIFIFKLLKGEVYG